jgi:hypothetical protein
VIAARGEINYDSFTIKNLGQDTLTIHDPHGRTLAGLKSGDPLRRPLVPEYAEVPTHL